MRFAVKQIPNAITSLNLVSGIVAVFFAIDGHLTLAGIFICVAAVLDFLDGLAARMLDAYSEVGKNLDSLADLVSFGVAPASILFTLLEFSMFDKNMPLYEIDGRWDQWLILFTACLMPVAGAVRLARFNAYQSDGSFFRGLPIPSNGLFWASMGMMPAIPRWQGFFTLAYSTHNLMLLGLFTSGMMIISLPMFSLKFKNLTFKDNWYRYLFIVLTVILLLFMKTYGLALVIISYILINIIFYLAGYKL
jgi:CDP-diacylglycerol--serine O-phosphatidyltransferase